MNQPLIALLAQPDDPPPDVPQSPLSEGDILLFTLFVVVVAVVFGFDMVRTWWETNEWRREARRRRREIR